MISFNGFKMQDLGKKTQVIQHIFAGKINANIRQKGENASLNSVLVPKNTRLNYGHIALHCLSRVKRNQSV
ncbi:hypothetical protein HpHA289_02810 [Helicobacter pylori]